MMKGSYYRLGLDQVSCGVKSLQAAGALVAAPQSASITYRPTRRNRVAAELARFGQKTPAATHNNAKLGVVA